MVWLIQIDLRSYLLQGRHVSYISVPNPCHQVQPPWYSTLPLDGNHHQECQRPSITVVTGPSKTFKKPFKGKGRKGYPNGLCPRSGSGEVSFNAKPSAKPFKSFSRKRLREPISNLLGSWNVFQLHCSKVLNLSLPLALDFHMLRAGMVLRVRGQGDGSLVVTKNDRGGFSLAHV